MGQGGSSSTETSFDKDEQAPENQLLARTKPINESLRTKYRHSKAERKRLQKEKDALELRLGKVMSAKVYHNNPAIADLSDPYRPTKLAEQFSRIYDNEWTSAFDELKILKFSRRDIVEILLDVVMESYKFCGFKLNETWTFVQKWFLIKGLSSVETIKALKDGRKQKMVDNIPELQEEFYLNACDQFKSEARLAELVNCDHLKKYINKCIMLCLMMNACDPPVFIEIQEWKPLKERAVSIQYCIPLESTRINEDPTEEPGQTTLNKPNMRLEEIHQNKSNRTESMTCVENQINVNDTSSVPDNQIKPVKIDAAHFEAIGAIFSAEADNKLTTTTQVTEKMTDAGRTIIENTVDQEDNNTRVSIQITNDKVRRQIPEITNTQTETNFKDSNDEKLVLDAKSNRYYSSTVQSSHIDECLEALENNVDTDLNKRPEFDENKFKTFTRRGKYVKYYVWPVVYLTRNGQILNRGFAQGTSDPTINL